MYEILKSKDILSEKIFKQKQQCQSTFEITETAQVQTRQESYTVKEK